MDYTDAQSLFAKAIAGGGTRLSLSRISWDISSNCMLPHHREIFTRSDNPSKAPLWIELKFRCRKCDACRRTRAALWRARAQDECRAAYRTWFGTLTLTPERHQHCYLEACRREAQLRSADFDSLSYGAQFAKRAAISGAEVSRFLKRVRKGSGPLRHLTVTEQHKSGLPHYHMLIHEKDPKGTREAVLSKEWTWGHSKFRLCDPTSAAYVCKYLSKSNAARVRASLRYGKDVLKHSPLSDLSLWEKGDHAKGVMQNDPV